MKKIVLSLLALAATMNIMAVTYSAKATITLESTSNYESCEIIIGESSALAEGVTNGEAAELNMEGRSVALYVDYEGVKYQHFASNPATMQNLALGVKTNAASNYNLYISDVTGSFTLKIGDAEPFVVTEGSRVITLTPNQSAAAFGIINYVPAPVYDAQVTTNEDGWASFSYAGNLAPVDASAQTLYKGAINGNVLDLYAVDYVKEDQGVLVKGAANTTYYFAAGSGSSDFAGNDLKPASAWENHTGTIFCLKGNALYEYTGSDMPANKAYLEISSSSAPARIILRFNEEQGIEDVKAGVQAEKFVENGQVFIRRGNEVFNLQGQIVK